MGNYFIKYNIFIFKIFVAFIPTVGLSVGFGTQNYRLNQLCIFKAWAYIYLPLNFIKHPLLNKPIFDCKDVLFTTELILCWMDYPSHANQSHTSINRHIMRLALSCLQNKPHSSSWLSSCIESSDPIRFLFNSSGFIFTKKKLKPSNLF